MIGALGKMQKLPRFNENDEIVPAHIMQVSFLTPLLFELTINIFYSGELVSRSSRG